MTKVSVFGQQPTETKELKKIEFVKRIHSEGSVEDKLLSADIWGNVMLYRKGDSDNSLDMILAWDDDREKAFYLGHWNDGVV